MTRILWFHPRFPWPVRHGGDLRTTGLVDCALKGGHEVLLVTPCGDAEVIPEQFRHHGFRGYRQPVRVVAKLLSRHPLRSPRLKGADLRTLRSAIDDFRPSLAVVSEVMAWSVAEPTLPRGLPWVYDSPNVESALFAAMVEEATERLSRLTLGVDARRVRGEERRMLEAADHVITPSGLDAEVLRAQSHGPVTVVPSSVAHPRRFSTPASAAPIALYVGTLDYPPNVAAVEELLQVVFPRVRDNVPAELVVVGRRPSARLREWIQELPWATLHTDVPDLGPFYAHARCAVLPLRTGSGTKLKVFEALAHGLPLVATSCALQGIPVTPGRNVLSDDDPDVLARLVVEVLTDDALARRLSRDSRALFDEHLTWSVAGRSLESVISSVAKAPT